MKICCQRQNINASKGTQEKRGHHTTASALLSVSLRPGIFTLRPRDLVPRAPFQNEMMALTCTTNPTVLLPMEFFCVCFLIKLSYFEILLDSHIIVRNNTEILPFAQFPLKVTSAKL